jgi:hypothetical protein
MLVRFSQFFSHRCCDTLVASRVLRLLTAVAALAFASSSLRASILQAEVILPANIGGELQETERERSAESKAVVRDESNATIVSVLLRDGRWTLGRLHSVRADSWSLLVRDAGSVSERDIASNEIIAFVVRRQGLRPAIGSDAELRQQGEGSLLRVTPLSLGVIDTIDGQRIPGSFRVVNGVAYWDHRWIGALPIDLEEVSRLRMIADRWAPQSADSDTALLVNGDVVRGFIDAISEDLTISATPLPPTLEGVGSNTDPNEPLHRTKEEAAPRRVQEPVPTPNREPSQVAESTNETQKSQKEGASTRKIAMNRVAAIALAEMPAEPRTGLEVWTSDGSLVAARNLTFEESRGWGFQLASDWLSKVRSKPTSDNSAADPVAGVLDRSQFTPLSTCSVEQVREKSDSYLYGATNLWSVERSERFLLGCADVSVEGPCTVRFTSPTIDSTEETLLTGVVSIMEPAPIDVRLEVTIGFERGTSETFVLDGTTRTKSFVIRASAGVKPVVVVKLSDGGNGIIGDRIVLERAALLSPR